MKPEDIFMGVNNDISMISASPGHQIMNDHYNMGSSLAPKSSFIITQESD
jgi:hypothetical protein